jgi:hypothetical protein
MPKKTVEIKSAIIANAWATLRGTADLLKKTPATETRDLARHPDAADQIPVTEETTTDVAPRLGTGETAVTATSETAAVAADPQCGLRTIAAQGPRSDAMTSAAARVSKTQ